MVEGRIILCFASGYDAPPTSKHHVMHVLAERNVVLWVNYHASRAPTASRSDMLYLARTLGQVLGGMASARKNLHVLTPLVVPLPDRSWARRLNRWLVVRQVRRALRRLPSLPVQIWSFTPDVHYVLGRLGEEKVLYYCVDEFASFTGYNRRQVLTDEAQLCRRADLVVTTSLKLLHDKAPLNPRTVLVRHGVDHAHFARALSDELEAPPDVAEIPRPRMGFFGLIRDWVDLDLVAAVAARRSDWHFVFVGDSTTDLGPYRRLTNLHFLGRRDYRHLPAYCRQFDVGLIPFRINDLTAAVNPIKLREYLAAGLPVVSTPLPEVRACAERVHVAEGPEAFAAAIDAALRDGKSRQERSQAVACETWPEKVEAISRCLESLPQRRDRPEEGPELSLQARPRIT